MPDVQSATYDRAFPNTLRVVVVPERPVAVIRQGAAAWLVSGRGRVLRALARGTERTLPRIWLPRSADVQVGATVAPDEGGQAAAALATARRVGFHGRVRDVSTTGGSLVFSLRSGLQLRLGDEHDLALKLAVAARILPLVHGAAYLDVSLPARPVAGSANPIWPPAPGHPKAVDELPHVVPKPAPITTPIVRLAGMLSSGSGSVVRMLVVPSVNTSGFQIPPGLVGGIRVPPR